MVKVCAVVVPPPGAGVVTVTETVPAAATSEPGTAALKVVALPNVVVRAVPFQFTTEPLTKFVPVTVSVNADAPAAAVVGEIEVSVGAGLLMLKVCEDDVPPTGVGLNTVTEAVPDEVRSPIGTVAVSDVALTSVVVSAEPFHFTTEPLTKFVPVTVRVNAAPPTLAEVGEMDVSVGTGLLIENRNGFDCPPPGEGLE